MQSLTQCLRLFEPAIQGAFALLPDFDSTWMQLRILGALPPNRVRLPKSRPGKSARGRLRDGPAQPVSEAALSLASYLNQGKSLASAGTRAGIGSLIAAAFVS